MERIRAIALLAATALLAAAVVPGLFGGLQRSFLYFPLPQEPPPIASVLPEAEELTFRTEDGIDLRGWYRAARAGAPTVLVFNGNSGDRSHRAPLATALAAQGFGVLLFDYRGYAGNAGTPSEEGLLADARAAADALRSRGVDTGRTVYFGESLGAAVAIKLAAERPPLATVLRSPFTSLEEMAEVHYPWLPIGPLLVDHYDSIGLIGEVHAPLLIIAGTGDRTVPLSHSRRLYDAASEPKRFVAIEGADHNDIALLAGDRLIEEVASFIAER